MKNTKLVLAMAFVSGVASSGVALAELPTPYLQVCLNLPSPPGPGATPSDGWLDLTDEQQNFKDICNNIAGQSDDEDDTAVAALRHEEVAAQGAAAIESSKRHMSNVSARINAVRQAASGGGAGDENKLLESSRWGGFANGNFNKGDRTQTVDVSGAQGLGDASVEASTIGGVVQGERAFDFEGQDLSLGVDYRFPGEKMILGAALGHNQQESDFTTEAGDTDLKGYHISAYSTYLLSETTYIDGVISFGNSDIDASRPVPVFDSKDKTVVSDGGLAFANTSAKQLSVSLGAGYEFNTGSLNVTPYTRFDYSKTDIDGYTETVRDNGGASRFDSSGMVISVADQSIDSLIGTLGIKASYPISTSSGVFVPQASVELKHQFRNDERFIEAKLPVASDVNGVTVNPNTQTSEPDRNYVRLGLGVSAVFPNGRSGFVQLESLQSSDDFSDTAIKAGFRMEF